MYVELQYFLKKNVRRKKNKWIFNQ